MTDATARHDLTPSSALPLAYFALAHAGLAGALLVLVLDPWLPGAFFYHPRMVAVVHLVTLAWLSGSILGAFYIVAPLALRLPLPVGRTDWIAFVGFAAGTSGMVAHFWIGTYDGMAWSAGLVTAAIGWVACRTWRRLPMAVVPWAIKLHVALAFVNILGAAVFGILLGLDRSRSFLGMSLLGATYAHAHLAAIGWVAMMVVGLSYRLIPMMLPAAMPAGASLAASAILLESGLAVLTVTLARGTEGAALGAGLVTLGLVAFVARIRRALRRRLPRPPALPRRDWSTWQAHASLLWLLVATALGVALSVGVRGEWTIPLGWAYGVAGIVGFLAQIVVGVQGRLVPLYAWYRAMAARGGAPPDRGANQLPSETHARRIFLAWLAGVPLLAVGLPTGHAGLIAAGSATLLVGTALGAGYLVYLLRTASRSTQ